MKTFYLRDKTKHPVALVGVESLDDQGRDAIHFAVATWFPGDGPDKPGDIFDKDRAMEIVEGRLAVGRSITLPMGPNVKRRVVEYISRGEQPQFRTDRDKCIKHRLYPLRTRLAAELWLESLESRDSS